MNLNVSLQADVAVLTRWRWCAAAPDVASPSWFSRLAPAWRAASLWRTGRVPYCRTATVKHNVTMNVNDATVCIFRLRKSHIYCPPTKLQKGNIFSRNCPSVSHSVHGERSHVDITHDALDLTIQDPGPTPSSSPPHSSPEMVPNCTGPSPCPTTTSEIWWPRVEACLNLFTWGTHPFTGADIWWLLKDKRLVSGRYAF